MNEPAFVVRTLATTSLKGAFRIHISPEALQQLHLKLGDLCTIIGEDGTRGAGIAWRATDRMGNTPKSQSVKMTEILREAFGFKQGSQVRIEKSPHTEMPTAKRISLTEISPDYEGSADRRSKMRCSAVLLTFEAISVGTTFDVGNGEGPKKRYFVENIESDPAQDQPTLYDIDDHTEVQILDGPPQSPVLSTTSRPLQINAAGIGGLNDQIEQLNLSLRLLCSKARALHTNIYVPTQAVLLHGYEGTGKTTLLKALARVPNVKKIIRIDKDQLLQTPSKAKSILQPIFEEAVAFQPSMILLDNVSKIAGAGDAATAPIVSALDAAFDIIAKSQVLVVGATRSVAAVDSTLLQRGRFGILLELPIPDLQRRVQILRVLLPEDSAQLAGEVAGRTHGFTGDDLGRLCDTVLTTALVRQHEEVELWSQSDVLYMPSREFDSGRSVSIASTLVERASPPALKILATDFDVALGVIRPSALREVIVEPPKVTFHDIGGSADLQTRFDRIIRWPTQYADLYRALPRKQPRKGILLYGPPGCSKTMTAQAVASTYGWNFVAVKGAELISMYVGESERAVREIFRKARQAAPTIIFFDEIDSIATARSGTADASKSLNVVTTLLTEMDGFSETKNVLVLAATNQPYSLDPAILRPGRFDEHVYLGPPNAIARREILKIYTEDTPLAESIDFDELVKKSDGMSGAEIKEACDRAVDGSLARAIAQGSALQITGQDLLDSITHSARGITSDMLQRYEEFANVAAKS